MKIGIWELVFLVLLVLKLTGVILWSWWWVASPLLFVVVLLVIAGLAYGVSNASR